MTARFINKKFLTHEYEILNEGSSICRWLYCNKRATIIIYPDCNCCTYEYCDDHINDDLEVI